MNNNHENFDALSSKAGERYSIDPKYYDKYNVKRGLRNRDGSGVMAGFTNISEVHGYVINEDEKHPMPGELIYRGYNIMDLVPNAGINKRYGFEEIAFLLLMGELPTRNELEEFCGFIAQNRELPANFTEDMILKAPSRDIMNKMARSVLALYSYDDTPDDCSIENILRQSLMLLSKMPLVGVYAYNTKIHYFDNKSLILHNPKPNLTTAENLLRMINPYKEFTPLDAEVLDTALMLHAEHGGGNNSTFTCRVLSSTGTDTYSTLAAAIGSLKGPKHGGANVKVIKMIDNIKENVKDTSNDKELYDYLIKIVKKEANDMSGLIYGMGHAVYTVSDPRTQLLKEKARLLSMEKGMQEEFDLYDRIEKMSPKVFADVKGDKKTLCANVDFYSGLVYKMLNIPLEMYTPIFAIARTAGWCAHRREEVLCGGRIIRPAYKSLCRKLNRTYKPLEDR
ncbi:MAG: citrate/2-methylcitrate synthase [Clostridia bacterium]|nr:citrate/2-methylcitrate synthase [Clostridia bacterium]